MNDQETPLARPIATEPTLTPAAELALVDPGERAPFSAADRAAAEVLIQHLFAPPQNAVDGIEHATAYLLAAGAVGGDIVDVYHFDNGDTALSIADISGKGVQAAIHAALVKYGLRCFASEGLTPERVLRALDRVYLENNAFERTESFASVFFAIVDKSRRAFVYGSAGHEPVVVVPPHAPPRVLAPTAPLVGIFDDQHHLFKQELVEIIPGMLLVATTDGVTEARSLNGEQFGIDRLVDVVEALRDCSPRDIVDGIVASVEAFSEGRRKDDIAVLAVRLAV